MLLSLRITETLPMYSSAPAVSFMSMMGFRAFIYSYGDVPGSQMAVIIGKPTTRGAQ